MKTLRDVTERLASFVTTHNRLVIVLMLVLTAGVAMGITQDQGDPDQQIDEDALGDTDVFQAAEYIEESYGEDNETEQNLTMADVYLITDEESALTRGGLLTALEYQQDVLADPAVSGTLVDDGIEGPPNMVARALAEDPDADLETQYAAIEAASEEEIAAVVSDVFAGGEETAFYLPTTYEAGSTDADAIRMTFTFDLDEVSGAELTEAEEALHEAAGDAEVGVIFADVLPALHELNQEYLADAAWLVIPAILLVLVIILGFAYRDVTDVVLGFTGTLFALLWTAGLMGWMGLLNQQTAIVAPVLVAVLSIDFGFHVFMRYRERRGPGEGIRAALARSTAAVTIAFVLVTITAVIGFMSNQTSPVGLIRDLGVAISLGVVAALLIFITLVPALKVSADGLWERFGFDRRKTALGKGRYLSRVLGSGATLAQRGAIVVIVVAVLVGLAGGLAFTDLDREAWQQADFDDRGGWQSELPEPFAFTAHESAIAQNFAYVQDTFQADQDDITEGGLGYTTMLIEPEESAATPEAMSAVATGHDAALEADKDIVLHQNGHVQVISPLTLMEQLAAHDPAFAEQFDEADTTGDGVPDQDIEALFDSLFDVAPEEAAEVIERTDDGEYESMLLLVPGQQEMGSERATVMHDIADEMASSSNAEVTAVGMGTITDAELQEITDGIVMTLVLAMLGILLTLAVVYRVVHRNLALGVVTVVPIILALGMVFGGMYLLGQPLTMLTAMLVAITIGLGIDYNIHISDRFAQELERGNDVPTALREAVTGTGGALLGSAVTSGGGFSLLMIIPDPQMTSFGLIVALALGVAFIMSVFVLPSLLWVWAKYSSTNVAEVSVGDPAIADD